MPALLETFQAAEQLGAGGLGEAGANVTDVDQLPGGLREVASNAHHDQVIQL
jgi:hypothetical protein